MPKAKIDKRIDLRSSYTAADAIPFKVLLDDDLRVAVAKGKIRPLHIQFIPTNACNLNCYYCSCSKRDKKLAMDIGEAKRIIDLFWKLRTKAVTITGGGEPLCYPHLDDLVEHFYKRNIKMGLVTNGLLLHKAKLGTLRKLVWCRISCGDDREFKGGRLAEVASKCKNVDWALSYVVSQKYRMDAIVDLVGFANKNNFTHVRLVADLFIPEAIDMGKIKAGLKTAGLDDSLVIYQGRKEYSVGGDCYLCYLKPLISPDFKIYACCGVQYATAEPARDLMEDLCMGGARDIGKIIEHSSVPFDGSKCVKCYYKSYNDLLGIMLKRVKHKEFL